MIPKLPEVAHNLLLARAHSLERRLFDVKFMHRPPEPNYLQRVVGIIARTPSIELQFGHKIRMKKQTPIEDIYAPGAATHTHTLPKRKQ